MKKFLLINLLCFAFISIEAQRSNFPNLEKSWQIGIGFGEIPYKGSFKPSLTFGYHLNERLYFGFVYQFKDKIQRDGSSFNVQASGLDGVASSQEQVAQRMMLHGRYTPFKQGPFISFGLVYNGHDVENMHFDARDRMIQGLEYAGSIGIIQSRPSGWGPALGVGYQYNFRNGLSLNAEWSPAWFTKIKEPDYQFADSADLSPETQTYLANKMTDKFQSTVTNRYKVFHIGLAYRFK